MNISRFVPILTWLPRYDRAWFRFDAIAGLTLWGSSSPRGWRTPGSRVCRRRPASTRWSFRSSCTRYSGRRATSALGARRRARQVDVLAAFVATGGSVADAAARVGIRPSTAKRHLANLRAPSGLSTEQLIYRGRAEGWLVVDGLEPG